MRVYLDHAACNAPDFSSQEREWMESTQENGDRWDELQTNYVKHLPAGVELPRWAARSFALNELAVLGAIRDAAYKAPDGACSLSVSEIARLAEVSLRTAARTIMVAIAAGIIERDGRSLLNLSIQYKVG
jgi:hypothetical protein